MPQSLNNFFGFAIKAGDGSVKIMNGPDWYTDDSSILFDMQIENIHKAEFFGAIMIIEQYE